jgi:hypothetical protein
MDPLCRFEVRLKGGLRMRITVLRAARRACWLVALSLSLAVLLAGASLAAAAGPPFEASGSFVQTSFVQSNIRSADGVTFFDFTEHDALVGTFSGTSVIQGSCVVPASGQGVCHAVETFTGAVEGESGTARFSDVIFLDLTTGAVHGSFTVVGGTGELASLHGHGTFQGTSGAPGTYTGRLVFAP